MTRYIIRYDYSDAFSSREQAINFYAVNHIQRQNDETVRILNEQEEKEFAWEWFKKAFRPDNPKDLVDAKIFFEKEWKEQEK